MSNIVKVPGPHMTSRHNLPQGDTVTLQGPKTLATIDVGDGLIDRHTMFVDL